MPTKSTKNTQKSNSKPLKISEKKSWLKTSAKKTSTKESSTKKTADSKVVIKRRKVDLTPSKASAVAITTQANRAKKQALIKKLASTENMPNTKNEPSNNTKIPLWVRIFFWCSLLLFCISFYQAIIRPQIEKWITNNINIEENNWNTYNAQDITTTNINNPENNINNNLWKNNSEIAQNIIGEFFNRLSNRNFDEALSLFTPALRNSTEIKEHFTAYRMNPFLNWILWWKLTPTNFQNISYSWKEKYSFNLSYTISWSQETYNENREFIINTSWEEPKISSIMCITSKCSYHPIFWPENFNLTK